MNENFLHTPMPMTDYIKNQLQGVTLGDNLVNLGNNQLPGATLGNDQLDRLKNQAKDLREQVEAEKLKIEIRLLKEELENLKTNGWMRNKL